MFVRNSVGKNGNCYRKTVYPLLDMDKVYYDALVTRPWSTTHDKKYTKKIFDLLKQIWDKKDITIIEGEYTRLGIGNDLFDNTVSIERIICPAVNAFSIYEKIYDAAIKTDKNRLVILALGPTATVLSYDMAMRGYQALDVGHLDIEYEWYINDAKYKTVIKNKYVNEVKGGDKIGDCNDEQYKKQIVKYVLE